ncbi:phage terminase small subunit [Asticcacaulis solisilvae]|uniref:phage terminase small subunit n=1 Tax=Asticcacaulis solisilvae TaxID=1217274 RepID=UPI003FD87899
MLSPAQRHLMRTAAAAAIVAAGAAAGLETIAPARPEEGPEATAYNLLMAQLGADRRRLSDIASTERKVEAKREMIEAYQPHIDAVLDTTAETGKAVQDEVFVTLMIWHIDVAYYDRALQMAEHVLTHGLVLPDRFNRNAQTLIAEEIAEAGLKATSVDEDFDLDILGRALTLVQPYDVNDIVQSKLRKAIGLQLIRRAEATEADADGPAGGAQHARSAALEMLTTALRLNPQAGVKKEIERLRMALRKNPPAEQLTE